MQFLNIRVAVRMVSKVEAQAISSLGFMRTEVGFYPIGRLKRGLHQSEIFGHKTFGRLVRTRSSTRTPYHGGGYDIQLSLHNRL